MNQEELEKCKTCPICGDRPILHERMCLKRDKLDIAIELLENDIKDMEKSREDTYEESQDDEIYKEDELIIEGMNIALILIKQVKQ